MLDISANLLLRLTNVLGEVVGPLVREDPGRQKEFSVGTLEKIIYNPAVSTSYLREKG